MLSSPPQVFSGKGKKTFDPRPGKQRPVPAEAVVTLPERTEDVVEKL